MSRRRNPGRVAGMWYLLLVVLGPVRLIYIPDKLFVHENAAATVGNIVAHERLFRLGMVADVLGAVTMILLVMAFYRMFAGVDRQLAVLVVVLGGVMPATLYFVNVANDAGVLLMAKGGGIVAAFSRPQTEALAMSLLRLHDYQTTAAETLWGAWLLPLAMLVYRSGFLPRWLGVWLGINGVAYVILSLTGLLAPQDQGRLFQLSQPALMAEMALMLWLVIRGGSPAEGSGSTAAVL